MLGVNLLVQSNCQLHVRCSQHIRRNSHNGFCTETWINNHKFRFRPGGALYSIQTAGTWKKILFLCHEGRCFFFFSTNSSAGGRVSFTMSAVFFYKDKKKRQYHCILRKLASKNTFRWKSRKQPDHIFFISASISYVISTNDWQIYTDKKLNKIYLLY